MPPNNCYATEQLLRLTGLRLEVRSHSGKIERARQAECPGERPTSLGEIEAVRIGMQ
jgi:hypothetical protein